MVQAKTNTLINIYRDFSISITLFVLGIAFLIFSSCNVSKVVKNSSIKKVKNADGTFTLCFFENKRLSKKETYNNNGVRNGISEEWFINEEDSEFLHIVYFYQQGTILEKTMLGKDSTIIEKRTFSDGRLNSNLHFVDRDSLGRNYYVKKVYDINSYVLYHLINTKIIDSISVSR
jgi:hypothetical protein